MLTRHVHILRVIGGGYRQGRPIQRNLQLAARRYDAAKSSDQYQEEAKELAIRKPREIFEKEFPNYFKDGKYVSRISYVEFVDESLAKLKELGLERDINAYKELLRVFPPGMFWPKRWDAGFGQFHAPQQLAAVRLLHQMQMSGVKPDKEIEKLIVDAFSKHSDVWIKVIRMNYWSMKARNLDPNPLPEKLPKEPHQLAKVAVARMSDDPRTLITVTNSSRVPLSVDKTWIVFSQSPAQKELIELLPESSTLYVEEGGVSYVDRDYLSYYLLKYYLDDEALKKKQPPKPEFNYNTLKMKFFGKPIKEKLVESHEKHYVDGSYVLAVGATGTSSQDSLLSWLKIMEERNPKLGKLNVVFKMSRSSPEMVQYQEGGQRAARSDGDGDQNVDDEDISEGERWARKYTKKT